jgi:CheY-like chemotaxis protein
MDTDTKSRIFEPFFTTKKLGEGTGLGLTIVFGIIQQSGGGYSVESEPSKGTAFRIYFPKTDEPLSEGEIEVEAKLLDSPTGSETVLLVEDEERVRELVYGILQRNGYTVLQAACGEDALTASQDYVHPIHLLVTDIIMPGMNGRELAVQLMSQKPQLKVLYMSGHTDQSIIQLDLEQQSSAFLQKPFTPNELVIKVRQLLDEPVPNSP